MVRFLNFAALCFILCAPAQQRPTLDQLLEARFPTELTAASASGKIAWIENHRGVRNIFVAEPPDYAPRAVSTRPTTARRSPRSYGPAMRAPSCSFVAGRPTVPARFRTR